MNKANTNWSTDKNNQATFIQKLMSKLSWKFRLKHYNEFIKIVKPKKTDSILDVGVRPEENLPDSNFFEKIYPYPEKITVVSIEDCSKLFKDKYKKIKFKKVKADKKLPFKDKSFDIVVSWATLEHTGTRKQQKFFISELERVGKKLFITTPDKDAIYDPHTNWFFIHWLRDDIFRKICILINKPFWSQIENVNMLNFNDLKSLLSENKTVHILRSKFLGILPAHLFILKKEKMEKDKIVFGFTGTSNSYHDNSCVLVKNGKVVFAASEERYSRIKHDKNFPFLALNTALKENKINSNYIKDIAIGYPKRFFLRPFISRPEKLLEILKQWLLSRKLNFFFDCFHILKSEFKQNLKNINIKSIFPKVEVTYFDHHLSHAASAFYTSGFENSLVIVLDAFGTQKNGEFLSGAIYEGKKRKLEKNPIEKISVNNSIGLFYTSITMALGFTPGDGEGKTMGLASYGNPLKTYKQLEELSPTFKKNKWFESEFWAEEFFANRKEFKSIFDCLRVGKKLNQIVKKYGNADTAAGAQKVLEDNVISYVKYLLKKYPNKNLSLAGGVFLNVKLNQKLMEIKGIEKIYVHPNAGDGGTALGASILQYINTYGEVSEECMLTANLGSEYKDSEILKEIKKYGKSIKFKKYANIEKKTAELLKKGVVIGWFQGKFEWGPRALGYRSVLIDPSRMDIKDKLNLTLKNREWFMLFAPSVMDEYGSEYFEKYQYSPFMTLAFNVKKNKMKEIKAAIHIDATARPNSVTKDNNLKYYNLIKEFKKITGTAVVLNTSFNKHGLPIINSPSDAIDHLLWNCIDELIIGNYHVTRNEI